MVTLDIFGQVQEVICTVRDVCLNSWIGIGNEILHAYVLSFYITGL